MILEPTITTAPTPSVADTSPSISNTAVSGAVCLGGQPQAASPVPQPATPVVPVLPLYHCGGKLLAMNEQAETAGKARSRHATPSPIAIDDHRTKANVSGDAMPRLHIFFARPDIGLTTELIREAVPSQVCASFLVFIPAKLANYRANCSSFCCCCLLDAACCSLDAAGVCWMLLVLLFVGCCCWWWWFWWWF